ncbi:ctsD [Acrasis kona]|uniref:CtsD n=1 Tax=Acrasis kona TaxID=1008807 RepID=A0AAW2Z6M4_9EUKA
MVVDTSDPNTYVYCCRSKHMETRNRTTTYCSKQDRCNKNLCESSNCPDLIIYHTKYSLSEGKSAIEAHIKTDLKIEELSFKTDIGFTQSTTNKDILTTFVEDDYFKNTEGWLGLGFSPFPQLSFYREMLDVHKGPHRTAQVGLDIFTSKQRANNDHLLPSDDDRSIFSYGGNMILGTSNINSYLNSVPTSAQFITWSQPLRRYNELIWKKLTTTETETKDLDKYRYEYGQRFMLYQLSIECENNVFKDLFYNYTGSWQAQIDTTITGIALPTDFYNMVKKWRPDNSTNPFLTFSLEHDGRRLRFPISWLQEELYNQFESILVYKRNVIVSPDPLIRIGTLFLEKYFVILDYTEYRIGFAEKEPILEKPTCPALTQCEGSDEYYEPTNECLPPMCDSYFFQYYDEAGKECKMYISFYILFPMILGGLCLSEFLIYEIYRRLTTQLILRASTNQ